MMCFSVSVDVGVNPPPVISAIRIDGVETLFSVEITNTKEILKTLNQIKSGFVVTQTETSVIIGYTASDLKQIEVNVDGEYTSFTKHDCCDDCFSDLVVLKGVCEPKGCNLILNDIGIDQRFIEQIITSDYPGVKEFFNSQLRLARNDIAALINSYVMPVHSASSILTEGKIGVVDGSYKSQAGDWQGILMQLDDYDYSTYISTIGLNVKYNATIPVCIFDADTWEMLDCVILNTISGVSASVKTNIKVNRNRIFIGYQPEGNHRETVLARGMCCGKTTRQYPCFNVTGAYGNLDSLSKTTKTGGLMISYSTSCDYDTWLCRNAQALSLPMMYRTAQNIYQYALTHSKHSRINTVTAINTEEVQTSLAWVTEKFNESINNSLKRIRIPSNKCFKCNNFANVVLSLP